MLFAVGYGKKDGGSLYGKLTKEECLFTVFVNEKIRIAEYTKWVCSNEKDKIKKEGEWKGGVLIDRSEHGHQRGEQNAENEKLKN